MSKRGDLMLDLADEVIALASALRVAENALQQNVIMCLRAKNAGVQNAGPLAVVTKQALDEVHKVLEPNLRAQVESATT